MSAKATYHRGGGIGVSSSSELQPRHPAFWLGRSKRSSEHVRRVLIDRMQIARESFAYCRNGLSHNCSDLEQFFGDDGLVAWRCGYYGDDLHKRSLRPLRCDECVKKKGQ